MNGRVPIVLLIEHDAIQRGTVARLLKAAGCCVIPVGRAHEALETFATHHVDIALVVADTQTNSLSGPPLLGALATIDPQVPVIALSSGVAIDRPAYEYPNVAVTLMRPFEPADVVVSVERVLQSPPGARFNWPPPEAELADIQVVDTHTWQDAQIAPAAVEEALAKPSSAPLIEMTLPELEPETAPPPRLVIRGLERRPWSRIEAHRLSPRTRRSLTVAATACCGLALTTLLELRGMPASPAPLVDETTPEIASLPVLRAHDHHIEATTLVSARRGMSPAVADVIRSPQPQPAAMSPVMSRAMSSTMSPTMSSATMASATSSTMTSVTPRRAVPSSEARAVAALATPPPSIAPVPAAPPTASPSPSPSPVETAATRDVPAFDAMTAASAPDAPAPERTRERDDERHIYQVLEQYERAYERLDVNAARAIWPSLNTRALARAFDGLKAQVLEFAHCRVAMASRDSEATATCGGSASYVPRVGRQAARTEPRQWTFHLRKIDQDWLIDKAEVR
jgi:DNA-binding response OmpR family regulator